MLTRRQIGVALVAAVGTLLAGPFVRRLIARQEQAPNRREFTIKARNYTFAPDRLEVTHNDIVKISISSEDQPHSFTLDEYRIDKRVPAGGAVTTFEFRADRVGTFSYYCSLVVDPGCRAMRGTLIVKPK